MSKELQRENQKKVNITHTYYNIKNIKKKRKFPAQHYKYNETDNWEIGIRQLGDAIIISVWGFPPGNLLGLEYLRDILQPWGLPYCCLAST